MIAEKIEAAALNKTNLIEIFSVGKKIHDVIRQCIENCCCSRYLSEFKILLENMNGEETTNEEKMKFYQLSTKHTKSFLLYDQINKKFGDEIYQLHDNPIRVAVFFEIEKIKKYLKTFNDIEKLEGFCMFCQKVLYDFFRKKKKKMSQNLSTQELNARLAEIYHMLLKIKIWVT